MQSTCQPGGKLILKRKLHVRNNLRK